MVREELISSKMLGQRVPVFGKIPFCSILVPLIRNNTIVGGEIEPKTKKTFIAVLKVIQFFNSNFALIAAQIVTPHLDVRKIYENKKIMDGNAE